MAEFRGVITRNEWGARPPRGTPTRISRVRGVALHWEGPKMGWFEHDQCAARVRAIQKFHMDSRGWADIAYSGLPCYHGYLFQGRWAGVRTAANGTNEANSAFYALCGLFGQEDPFTDDMKMAFWAGINILREHGGAGQDVQPHSAFRPTACPGPVRDWINAGLPLPQAPAPPPEPPAPNPPPSGDWTEEIIMGLHTIDLRNANNAPVKGDHLMDNLQGLLKGVQRADCDPGAIDMVGGGRTFQAVVAFQRIAGLDADGIVGPNTWRKLINW